MSGGQKYASEASALRQSLLKLAEGTKKFYFQWCHQEMPLPAR